MSLEHGRRAHRVAGTGTARSRRRTNVVGVLGELFITAGVLVLLFLGWQTWLGNLISGNEQASEAQALSQSWGRGERVTVAPSTERPDPGPPPVLASPAAAAQFANLIVPRLGPDYTRPIAQGVTSDVLRTGVGHYPGTQMPGEVGNTAFAAHRTGNGSPFFDIEKLQVGDSVYVETEAGWYRYVMRSLEYVLETGVAVLDPVPQSPGAVGTDRILTLTSCNPIFTASERIIMYALYDTWYPRDGGPPAEIAPLVQAGAAP